MNNSIKTALVTVFAIFIGFFLYTKLIGPIPFTVNSITTTKESLFTVDGKGEVTAVPDTAMLSLGVSKNATTVQDAQNQVNTVINQLTAELKKLGVEEKNIKTTNYSVNPNYDYNSGKQAITGYSVNADVQVRIKEIDKANQAIDIATKAGANQIGGVQFVLDEQKQKELEEQARKEAIDSAKEKAKSISEAAGINLGKIVDVRESNSGAQPLPYAMSATLEKDARANAPTDLKPGENKVTITVTLSYETY